MPAFSALAALGTALGVGGASGGAAGAATAGASAGAAGAAAGGATSLSGIAGLAGTAATIAGTGLQVAGQMKAQEAAEKAETLRNAQMNLEATRQRRQIIRQSLIARGQAVNSATAQGAAEGSGLAGGVSQIASQTGSNLAGVNASQGLGQAMFGANQQLSQAQTMSSFGSGLSSLGGALFQNQQQIGRLGTYITS